MHFRGMVAALAVAGACGGGGDKPPAPDPAAGGDGAATAGVERPVPELDPPAPGLPRLADFAYSRGNGRAAFKKAMAARDRGDWPAAEQLARAAIAGDPTHLEAHWLLARALVHQGRADEALQPTAAALAGDLLRWGDVALEDPLLATLREGARGDRLRTLIDEYRDGYRAIAGHGHWFVARRGEPWEPDAAAGGNVNHRAELYARDRATGRFVRLSRTNGSLVATLRDPAGARVAYVSYRKLGPGEPAAMREVRIGIVDPAAVAMSAREVALDELAALELWFAGDAGLIAQAHPVGGDRPVLYRLDVARGRAVALTSRKDRARATGAFDTLRVTSAEVALRRPQPPGVAADWDDDGAASALVVEATRKTIAVPDGELAARDSLRWSPERLRLAFATAPVDACGADPADRRSILYAADATTGKLVRVADGDWDFAPVWLDDVTLAYVVWDGAEPAVQLYDAAAGQPGERLTTPGGLGTSWLPAPRGCPPDDGIPPPD